MVRSCIITLATINYPLMEVPSEKKWEDERKEIYISHSFRALTEQIAAATFEGGCSCSVYFLLLHVHLSFCLFVFFTL